jgi:hypothetical protein
LQSRKPPAIIAQGINDDGIDFLVDDGGKTCYEFFDYFFRAIQLEYGFLQTNSEMLAICREFPEPFGIRDIVGN